MKVKNNCNQYYLCKNNCGFYGSPQYDGLCSKCHKMITQSTAESDFTHTVKIAKNEVNVEKIPTINDGQNSLTPACRTENSRNELVVTASVSKPESIRLSRADLPLSRNQCHTLPRESASSSVIGTSESSKSWTSLSPLRNSEASSDQSAPNRCQSCRKRVGLTGMKCRCGLVFCAYHRYSDRHDCTFDYQAEGQANIKRDNPPVTGDKLPKI